jgi:hypothetical protein
MIDIVFYETKPHPLGLSAGVQEGDRWRLPLHASSYSFTERICLHFLLLLFIVDTPEPVSR